MRKITDESFGIVPIRKFNGEWQVLLIHQISNGRGDSYWIIPKGHRIGEERPVETAIRELQEETGLEAEQVDTDKSFVLNYTFRFEQTEIAKRVTFFIGYISPDAQTVLQTEEVKEAGWYGAEEAYVRITHKNARKLLLNVFTYLNPK